MKQLTSNTEPVWILVAREGACANGRYIDPALLTSLARNYMPELYSARVNAFCLDDKTHLTLGDILALKTEREAGVLCLYALIDSVDQCFDWMALMSADVYPVMECIFPLGLDSVQLIGVVVIDHQPTCHP